MADLDQMSQPAAEAPPGLDPELARKIGAFRTQFNTSFAQVVLTLMATARYRHCALHELQHLALDPLLHNRIAIAQARSAEGAAPSPRDAVAGIAIWAKVSPQVDQKIRDQIKAGVFPVRLSAQDWSSGDIAWVLDVIAPNAELTTAVMSNMKQVAGDGELFVHPVVRGATNAKSKPAQ